MPWRRSRAGWSEAGALLGACVLGVGLAATLSTAAPVAGTEPTDLLLVLAADVSRSVDQQKFELQRQGYATALSDPRVIEAIRAGPHRRIGISFVEWSGYGNQKLVIDWAAVGDTASARAFAARVHDAPRSFADRTSISGGIDFAVQQIEHAKFDAPRRVIDLSGDGTNNAGRDVRRARDEAVAKGIVINGLVILSERPMPWNPEHTNPPGGLAHYYNEKVIGGPGAFVMVAQDFHSFGQALINKLVAEIARAPAPRHAALAAPRARRVSFLTRFSPGHERVTEAAHVASGMSGSIVHQPPTPHRMHS
jgi:hypothetical protein